MGFAGDTRHPELVAAIGGIVATLQLQGRPWRLLAQADTPPGWVQRGAQFLYGTLEQILKAGYRTTAEHQGST